MNKLFTLALCGTILLSLTACGANFTDKEDSKTQVNKTETVNTITNEDTVQIPSPFIEYATLEEAEAAAGVKVTVPSKLPEGYTQKVIYGVDNDMVEIIYSDGENDICFRQAKRTGDISGDYNEYSEVNTVTINGVEVTTKGNNSKVNVAIWTSGDYAFSIGTDTLGTGIEKDMMTEMIDSIQ